MCFYLESDKLENFEIKKAKEDIICYKLGSTSKSKIGWPLFNPMYRSSFCYYKNLKTKRVKIKVDFSDHQMIIYEGYHSFISLNGEYFFSDRVGVFIIPKGTMYYINERDNVYVSERLIYKGLYSDALIKQLK